MALRLLGLALRQPAMIKGIQVGSVASLNTLDKIGSREIVGHGWNGSACYADRVDYPMPAVRFREITKDIAVLKEKEKGDWKKLSMEEKKALYRASFCQTFAEIQAPTGEWKMHIGMSLIFSSMAIFLAMILTIFVYPDMPASFNEENQKAQLKRMLELEMNPVHGLSSKWDYENKRWK